MAALGCFVWLIAVIGGAVGS